MFTSGKRGIDNYLPSWEVPCGENPSINEILDTLDTNFMNSLRGEVIINPRMQVIQRYKVPTANVPSGTCFIDRYPIFSQASGGSFPVITHSQKNILTENVDAIPFTYNIHVSGAGSGYGSSMVYYVYHPLENGLKLFCHDGNKITISWKFRTSIVGYKFGIHLQLLYGLGGSPVDVIFGEQFTPDSQLTEYHATFTMPSLAGKTFSTVEPDRLLIVFDLAHGSDYANRAGSSGLQSFVGAGDIEITDLQVDPGEEVLPHRVRSYAEEFFLCERYYKRSYDNGVAGDNTGNSMPWVPAITPNALAGYYFPQQMARTPNIKIYAENGTADRLTNTSGVLSGTNMTPVSYTRRGFRQLNSSTTDLILGAYYTYHYTADAELY